MNNCFNLYQNVWWFWALMKVLGQSLYPWGWTPMPVAELPISQKLNLFVFSPLGLGLKIKKNYWFFYFQIDKSNLSAWNSHHKRQLQKICIEELIRRSKAWWNVLTFWFLTFHKWWKIYDLTKGCATSGVGSGRRSSVLNDDHKSI